MPGIVRAYLVSEVLQGHAEVLTIDDIGLVFGVVELGCE
jgi:hypothetical protein